MNIFFKTVAFIIFTFLLSGCEETSNEQLYAYIHKGEPVKWKKLIESLEISNIEYTIDDKDRIVFDVKVFENLQKTIPEYYSWEKEWSKKLVDCYNNPEIAKNKCEKLKTQE